MSINALVIDDDENQTHLLSLHLRGYGINIIPANNGAEGLECLAQHNPDIVIIDLMMPGMDGWQVCHEIRKFSNVPIIILSVLDDPDHIANALDAGADDYLVKPATGRVLIAHINRLLRRAEAERTHNLIGSRPLPASKQFSNIQ